MKILNRKKSKQKDVKQNVFGVVFLSWVLANGQVGLEMSSSDPLQPSQDWDYRIILSVKALEEEKKMKGTHKINYNRLEKSIWEILRWTALNLNCRN